MKRILLVIVFTSFFLPAFSQFEALVWSDEFNGTGLPDPAYWNYDLGGNGWGNSEVQSYTNSTQNVRQENGSLVIQARKNGSSWSSARIKTQGKINFTYGRIKFRAKLPTGSGTWPALWMLGENISSIGWPACGEIDIMEHVGKNPSMVQAALHTPSSSGNTFNKGSKTVSTFSTEFHDYEALWTPDKIQFFIDGVSYYTYQPSVKNSSTWPFTLPQFLIINVAMGGNFGSDPQYETGGQKNGIDPTLTLATMEVDYVRVYQTFSQLTITGPNVVQKNQTDITYATNSLDGATYVWSVPADAVIVQGQGTASIKVNWGQTEGDVKATVTVGPTTYEKSVPVTHIVKPQGNNFDLMSNDFNIQWAVHDSKNQYSISSSNNVLRINYQIVSPPTGHALVGSLPRGIDLSEHPVLKVRVKTFNKSETLMLRLDLVDANNKATTQSPIFDFKPLIDDGEYYEYTFNYKTSNQWKSLSGSVDSTRISKINLYIDYGVFGSAGSDSLWIDDMHVETILAGPFRPNRPSHLSGIAGKGDITFNWQDNSTNEQGFKIYRASQKAGPYTELVSIGPNQTSANATLIGEDPRIFFYRINSFNASGTSDYSNILTADGIVTDAEDEVLKLMDFYPNPSSGDLRINLSRTPATIRIITMLGAEMHSVKTSNKSVDLDLSFLARGLYLVEILHKNYRSVEKIILQ